jgi:small multidrug resistance pump
VSPVWTRAVSDRSLIRFRPWFYAAAAYNLGWGTLHVLSPSLIPAVLGLESVDVLVWQVLGLFVGVYAPAYFWAARRPDRHAHLVAIGAIGKIAGLLGFVWAIAADALPWGFAFVVLTNDLIWLPAFCLYLRSAVRGLGSWRALAAGA